MQRVMMWLAMLGFVLGSLAFPATAGAQGLFGEDGSEDFEEETSLTANEDDSSISEEQYEDGPDGDEPSEGDLYEDETSEDETSEDDLYEETTSEADDFGESTSLEGESPEETTMPEDDILEESTMSVTGSETTGEEPTEEEPTEEEFTSGTTGPEEGGSGTPGGSETGSEGNSEPPSGNGNGTSTVPAPPIDPEETPPTVGETMEITIIDQTLIVDVVNIYNGVIICRLPNNEIVEIYLYDLDGDGWVSYYESYVCMAGWLGYRYYDYTPDQVYNFLGDTYNINISNTYEQTGAIRPTPVERVTGLLPDTGGPAFIGLAVGFAVVGAALVGRYSRRP